MKKATCSPGIEVSIGENDVRSVKEVSIGVATTECIESPVELRIKLLILLAIRYEIICAPKLREEHICLSILRNGHDHLIADLVAPAVIIKTRSFVQGNSSSNIHACQSLGCILENVEHYLKFANIVNVTLYRDSLSLSTSCLNWVGRKLSKEVCGIWIINHLHSAKSITNHIDYVVDLIGTHNRTAGLE